MKRDEKINLGCGIFTTISQWKMMRQWLRGGGCRLMGLCFSSVPHLAEAVKSLTSDLFRQVYSRLSWHSYWQEVSGPFSQTRRISRMTYSFKYPNNWPRVRMRLLQTPSTPRLCPFWVRWWLICCGPLASSWVWLQLVDSVSVEIIDSWWKTRHTGFARYPHSAVVSRLSASCSKGPKSEICIPGSYSNFLTNRRGDIWNSACCCGCPGPFTDSGFYFPCWALLLPLFNQWNGIHYSCRVDITDRNPLPCRKCFASHLDSVPIPHINYGGDLGPSISFPAWITWFLCQGS